MTKLIGMIGGVSWESTVQYYKLINQSVRAQLGDLNSAKLLLHSLNYEPIVEFELQGKWDALTDSPVPAFDTMVSHAEKAVALALMVQLPA